ncbi:MAG TPA: type II toxin-antitoxin system VapC family toxin [Steroidobacteraceae bacterium]|jgi:hypothetical protein
MTYADSTPRLKRVYEVAETPAEYVFRPKLYLDTTIPSYLTSRRSRNETIARRQWLTTVWWKIHREKFDVYISEYVIDEVKRGDPEAARLRLDALAAVPELTPMAQVKTLARQLLEGCSLPETAAKDAAHVAIAALHGMKFLLTWNCTHLANPVLAQRVDLTCQAFGLRCPTLCTPEDIMRYTDYERSNR